MPGPEYAGIVTFYEDFPYALWNDFAAETCAGDVRRPPRTSASRPTYADITDQLERKITGHQPLREPDGAALRRHRARWPRGPRLRPDGRRVRRGRRLRRAVLGLRPRLTGRPARRHGRRRGRSRATPVVARVRLAPRSSSGAPAADARAARRPRPVRPLGPRHRGQRPAATPTTRTSSFPPVMAYVWGILAAIEPAFQTVTDASDPAIRALMKTPASLADLGLAAARGRTRCATAALGGRRRRPRSCSTRPSSTSARGGASTSRSTCCRRWPPSSSPSAGATGWPPRPLARRADDQAAGAAVPPPVRGLVLGDRRRGAGCLGRRPIGAGGHRRPVAAVHRRPAGPRTTSQNLAEYQGDIFAILSLRAWNLWWLVQELLRRRRVRGRRRARSSGRSRSGIVGLRAHRRCSSSSSFARDPPRPAAADARPGPGRRDARRVLLPDDDARALRVRRARVPVLLLPGSAGRAGWRSPSGSSSR